MTNNTVVDTKTDGDHLDSKYGHDLKTTVDTLVEGSKVNGKGIVVISNGAFNKALATHGVTKDMVDKVSEAIDFTTTAAAQIARDSVEEKIKAASTQDLSNPTFRSELSTTVRLPTHYGNTEVTLIGESVRPISTFGKSTVEGDDTSPKMKTTYGRLHVKIHQDLRIHNGFQEETADKMRSLLSASAAPDID